MGNNMVECDSIPFSWDNFTRDIVQYIYFRVFKPKAKNENYPLCGLRKYIFMFSKHNSLNKHLNAGKLKKNYIFKTNFTFCFGRKNLKFLFLIYQSYAPNMASLCARQIPRVGFGIKNQLLKD